MEHNIVGWFEIPVKDMDRAVKFYETVFDFKMQLQTMESILMAGFPYVETGMGSGGALIYAPEFNQPSDKGTMVYLNAVSGDLNNELGRVEDAGGKVLMPKTLITKDIGYMAVFLDTEGNRIAFHSRK